MSDVTHTRAKRLALHALALGALAACAAGILFPHICRRIEAARQGARIDALVARTDLARPARAAYRDEDRLAAPRHPARLAPLTEEACSVPMLDDADLADEFVLDLEPLHPDMTSWSSVGGCGVGGGGGGGGVRWMGRRAPPGGYVEVELMSTVSNSPTMDASSLSMKLTSEIPGRLNVGLSIPWARNVGDDENYQELFGTAQEWTVSGPGDVTLLVSRKFGLEGHMNGSVSIGLPSGVHDAEEDGYVLPRSFQLGKGVSTLSGTFEYTFDKEWGMITVGTGLNLNGGENDIDNKTGDTYDGYIYAGYRTEMMVHSVGMKISRGLNKDVNQGVFEADQSRTEVTFQYGLEIAFSREAPIFLGVTTTKADSGDDDTVAFSFGVVASF